MGGEVGLGITMGLVLPQSLAIWNIGTHVITGALVGGQCPAEQAGRQLEPSPLLLQASRLEFQRTLRIIKEVKFLIVFRQEVGLLDTHHAIQASFPWRLLVKPVGNP